MPKKFPLFIDLTEKKVVVYGAGVIASRRVETLLAFTSSLTVFAPEASKRVQRAAEETRSLPGGNDSCRCLYGAGGYQ